MITAFAAVALMATTALGHPGHSHSHDRQLFGEPAPADDSPSTDCGFDRLKKLFPDELLNAGTRVEYKRLEQFKMLEKKKAIKNEECKASGACRVMGNEKFTIPIAWHVVYATDNQNEYMTDARIEAQLSQLNLDFNLKNPDGSEVPEEWQKLRGDAGIQFTTQSISVCSPFRPFVTVFFFRKRRCFGL